MRARVHEGVPIAQPVLENSSIQTLTSTIEPIVMIGVAIMVGVVTDQ